MQKCWLEDPNERIKFQEIAEELDAELIQMSDYVQFFPEDELMVGITVNRPMYFRGSF